MSKINRNSIFENFIESDEFKERCELDEADIKTLSFRDTKGDKLAEALKELLIAYDVPDRTSLKVKRQMNQSLDKLIKKHLKD